MHNWLNSARGDGYPSKRWNVHSLCLAKFLEISGGTTGLDNFAKRLKQKNQGPHAVAMHRGLMLTISMGIMSLVYAGTVMDVM